MLRQRGPKNMAGSTPGATQPSPYSKTGGSSPKRGHAAAIDALDDPRQPLLGPRDGATLSQRPLSISSQDQSPQEERTEDDETKEMENLSRKSQWIVLALASGACAAFNGVFAKLYVIFFCSPRFPIMPNRVEEEDILLLIQGIYCLMRIYIVCFSDYLFSMRRNTCIGAVLWKRKRHSRLLQLADLHRYVGLPPNLRLALLLGSRMRLGCLISKAVLK